MDDDDRKPRDNPSEIAQIASAFLEPEDLERMEKDGATDARHVNTFGGQTQTVDRENQRDPSSPTPGSPCPEDLPSQPHYPQSSNAPLVTNGEDEQKEFHSPHSPQADEASNGSSCSKRLLMSDND